MEIFGIFVLLLGIFGVFIGFVLMTSRNTNKKFHWLGAATFAGGFLGILVGASSLVSAGESYEEERDRIFEETYSSCMEDYASGIRVLGTEKGAASDETYVCEGEAWRAVERWRND